ncbi:MAG: CRTAC1 family protein [Candidatus Poribacteria bacterium]|nr:CRTAC1 family protein [Candidatus Poribacteria bacterium]
MTIKRVIKQQPMTILCVSRFFMSCPIFYLLIFIVSVTVSQSKVSFIAVTKSGIDFKHTDGKSEKRLFNEFLGSGGGFFDYDNDGDLDIYLVNGASQIASPDKNPSTNALYRNNGDGSFSNVTELTGTGSTSYGTGCTVGDYDNDGDLDLYIANFGPNVLYQNSGKGTFIDVSMQSGVANSQWGTSCAFADVDNDGNLDLYITNYADYAVKNDKKCYVRGIWQYCGPRSYPPDTDIFYHNNGNGMFTDLTEKSGFLDVPACHGLGVAFGDYDNDGDQDLYVANDQDPNFLFQNQGSGKFEETALLSGVSYSDMGKEEAGMGTIFGDYDNDGLLDLTVSNFQKETNTLYHNEGSGFFADVTTLAGIGEITYSYLGWGIAFFDYNNDGYKDIFVANGHVLDNITDIDRSTTYPQRNLLFRNLGDGTFEDVSNQSGSGLTLQKVSRTVALGDYDNDGDLDILVTNWNQTADLLRNEGGNLNNWIQINVVGTKSNKSGIGTRIKLVAGNLKQYQEVQSGGSYLAFSDLRTHFGVGNAKRIDLVEILWPSGHIDKYKDLAVNHRFIATENAGLEIRTE